MPWTVTRQRQWPDGTPMVEVSVGGRDYTNPDALAVKYSGEFETFDDPREAARVAIAICEAWHRDGETEAQVGHGATGGDTMPFSPCEYSELTQWAEERYAAMEKCPQCGDLLSKTRYTYPELPDQVFCSEFCVDEAVEEMLASEEPAFQVCDSCRAEAHDKGFRGRARQAEAMAQIGAEIEDHVCDAVGEPSIKCECGCNIERERRKRVEATQG